MSKNEIEPALTPEEWVKGEPSQPGDVWPRIERGFMRLECEDPYYDELLTDRGRHAIAALALYGQEFGFTWHDVDRLREMARMRVTHGHGDHGPPDQYDPWIADLADRIAALLPPRGS